MTLIKTSQKQALDTPQDPWHDWKPVWQPLQNEPPTVHDYQERQSPTENVLARIHGQKARQSCRRRIVDERLWSAMSPTQQDAALCIARAYEAMSSGLGFAVSDLNRIPGGQGHDNPAERQAVFKSAYTQWATACAKQKIHHSMIIDILVFGHSLGRQDKDRRVRKGTARQNLLNGLDLYCELQGWPVQSQKRTESLLMSWYHIDSTKQSKHRLPNMPPFMPPCLY